MKNNTTTKIQGLHLYDSFVVAFFLLLMQVPFVLADNTAISDLISTSNLNIWVDDNAITNLNFSKLSGNKVKIELSLIDPVDTPKEFKTDNPARIVLDFTGVHSNLEKKIYHVNQSAVETVYIAEASRRTRVIINLVETGSYETKIIENKVTIIVE